MKDAEIAQVAGAQFNRVSRRQLRELGLTKAAIERRVASGRLVIVEEGVLAIAPVLQHDDLGRWMAATLTCPGSYLSRRSSACAWGILDREGSLITVTRPGNGGPRRFGGVVAYRSSTLAGECTVHRGIPLTTVPRTLLDLASSASRKALARALRESVRLQLTTIHELGDRLGDFHRRRGARRLASSIARYSGLPLERARSGAEVRALEVLRDARRPLPRLNTTIAGEEADLSWPALRLIIEIDGRPFHLDRGEDARKESAWREAGWEVRRIPSNDVYDRPARLLELSSADPFATNVRIGLA